MLISLPTGTIYPAMHRLEAAGLIGSEREVANGRRRRSYFLTSAGALAAKRQDWQRISSVISIVLGTATRRAGVMETATLRVYTGHLARHLIGPASRRSEILDEVMDGLPCAVEGKLGVDVAGEPGRAVAASSADAHSHGGHRPP